MPLWVLLFRHSGRPILFLAGATAMAIIASALLVDVVWNVSRWRRVGSTYVIPTIRDPRRTFSAASGAPVVFEKGFLYSGTLQFGTQGTESMVRFGPNMFVSNHDLRSWIERHD